jgi:hypothetical protein
MKEFLYWVPEITVLVLLPALLIYVVFARLELATWKRWTLIPLCLVGPTAMSLLWPALLVVSGIIKWTSNGNPGFLQTFTVASQMFGDLSAWVWAGITTATVVLIFKMSAQVKKKGDGG